jgi:hypothetical protein
MKTDLHILSHYLVNISAIMSTSAIVNVTNANIENISFPEAKRNKQGGLGVRMLYSGQNFSLRLPRMNFPGGLLQREDEKTGNVSYSLIGSLKGCDPYAKAHSTADDDMSKLYNFLLDLQDKLIMTATENSSKWFGKKRGEESIRDSFNDRSILSLSSDKNGDEYVPNGKYPPSFRLKLPVYDGKVSMDVVDCATKPVFLTIDSLRSVFPKNVAANLVVSSSIYIIGQSFGVTWRITHAQVFPQTRPTASTIFEAVADATSAEQESTDSDSVTGAVDSTPDLVEVPVIEAPTPESAPPAAPKKRRAVGV